MKTILLLCALSAGTAAFAHDLRPAVVKHGDKDSLETTRVLVRKNAIRLFSSPAKGRVKVHSNLGSVLHFYIFDLDGVMIYQAELKGKEQRTVENLEKGTYVYNVFENDESIEEGKITIK
jgi:hypothetical protein